MTLPRLRSRIAMADNYPTAATVNVGSGTSARAISGYALPITIWSMLLPAPTLRHSSRRGLRTSRTRTTGSAHSQQSTPLVLVVPVAVGVGANQMPDQCLTGVRNEYQNINFNTAQTSANVLALTYRAPRLAPSSPQLT